MSEQLLNTARQTLLLELQEASRLPERLGMTSSASPAPFCTVKVK